MNVLREWKLKSTTQFKFTTKQLHIHAGTNEAFVSEKGSGG